MCKFVALQQKLLEIIIDSFKLTELEVPQMKQFQQSLFLEL